MICEKEIAPEFVFFIHNNHNILKRIKTLLNFLFQRFYNVLRYLTYRLIILMYAIPHKSMIIDKDMKVMQKFISVKFKI